jgi:hypothetical protein
MVADITVSAHLSPRFWLSVRDSFRGFSDTTLELSTARVQHSFRGIRVRQTGEQSRIIGGSESGRKKRDPFIPQNQKVTQTNLGVNYLNNSISNMIKKQETQQSLEI